MLFNSRYDLIDAIVHEFIASFLYSIEQEVLLLDHSCLLKCRIATDSLHLLIFQGLKSAKVLFVLRYHLFLDHGSDIGHGVLFHLLEQDQVQERLWVSSADQVFLLGDDKALPGVSQLGIENLITREFDKVGNAVITGLVNDSLVVRLRLNRDEMPRVS